MATTSVSYVTTTSAKSATLLSESSQVSHFYAQNIMIFFI